jgi:cysteine desulfurase
LQNSGIYLDSQATSGLAPGVLDAMMVHFSDTYGNPHSSEHAYGWRASDAVDRARAQVAAATGFDADEVVFTSGATEANNIAILGFDRDAVTSLVTIATEHKSVIAPMRERARRGSSVTTVPVDGRGVVDLDALSDALGAGARLVSVMAVNNEIGTAQPIAAIADLCHAAGALLHVDAAQALAFDAVAALAAHADIVSVSSHKAGGPVGIGALLVARHARPALSPISFGGGQEDGLRPGTLPMPLCVGFGAACAVLPDAAEVDDWRRRSDRLAESLAAVIPGSVRNGGGPGSHPGNVSLTLPEGDADAVIARLQPGVAASTGSACTSGIPEPSHVLRAIGLDAAAAERTIRLSVGRYTTTGEIEQAIAAIATAVRTRAAA